MSQASDQSRMCTAAAAGDVAALKVQLADGASVNVADPSSGLTPLHNAVNWGHVECVELMLDQPGIDIDRGDRSGKTALYSAVSIISISALDIVKLLLDRGADVTNRRSLDGLSPFHVACQVGSLEVIRLMFEQRNDVLLKDNKWLLCNNRKQPHRYTVLGRNVEVLKFLSEIDRTFGVEYSSEDKCTILSYAARLGALDVLKGMIDYFGDSVLQSEFASQVLYQAVLNEITGHRHECDESCLLYLVKHGCSAYSIDSKTGKVSLLISPIIASDRHQTLALEVLDHIESHHPLAVIAVYNCWYATHVPVMDPSDCGHPVHAAISALAAIESFPDFGLLRRVLRCGFDAETLRYSFASRSLKFYDVDQRYFAMLRHFAGASYGVIGHAIFTVRIPETLIEMVLTLIEEGVRAGATMVGEMSPLMALCIKGASEHTSDELVNMLISSPSGKMLFDSGIDAGVGSCNRRSPSPFASSDIAIVAALTRSTIVISEIAARVGLRPKQLLADLLKVDRVPVSTRLANSLYSNYNRCSDSVNLRDVSLPDDNRSAFSLNRAQNMCLTGGAVANNGANNATIQVHSSAADGSSGESSGQFQDSNANVDESPRIAVHSQGSSESAPKSGDAVQNRQSHTQRYLEYIERVNASLAENANDERSLLEIVAARFSGLPDANGAAARVLTTMRNNVAIAVRHLLNFTTRSPDVLRLCRDVDAHFAVDGIPAPPNAQSPWWSVYPGATNDPWHGVYAQFESVDSLQHMCRVAVVSLLLDSCVGGRIQEKIKLVPLPKSLRAFLTSPNKTPDQSE